MVKVYEIITKQDYQIFRVPQLLWILRLTFLLLWLLIAFHGKVIAEFCKYGWLIGITDTKFQ